MKANSKAPSPKQRTSNDIVYQGSKTKGQSSTAGSNFMMDGGTGSNNNTLAGLGVMPKGYPKNED